MPNLNNCKLLKKKKKIRQQAVEAEIPHSFYSWATHLERYGAYGARITITDDVYDHQGPQGELEYLEPPEVLVLLLVSDSWNLKEQETNTHV